MELVEAEHKRKPELEVELEMEVLAFESADKIVRIDTVDDLDDPWFDTEPPEPDGDGAYEVDPVHPLRRLSAWVRGRLAA
jgi:hypothetical protein